jgi:lysozyme
MTQQGLDLIKKYEGLRLEAYKCPAGVWTIGYGHTKGVVKGMKISKEEAEELLKQDVSVFELQVINTVGKLSDCKIDALVSFAYNVGIAAFRNSTLCRKVKANSDDPAIRNEFMKWIYAGGKKLQGLERRRKEEAEMYFS